MPSFSRFTPVALLACLATGCGSGQPSREPVYGHVFWRGQPLAGGTIVFTPDSEKGGKGPVAWAEIQPDGRYSLRTGTDLGAVVGWHRVTVVAHRPHPGGAEGMAVAPTVGLSARYSDPEQSGHCYEVKDGHANTIDIYLD